MYMGGQNVHDGQNPNSCLIKSSSILHYVAVKIPMRTIESTSEESLPGMVIHACNLNSEVADE